MYMNVKPTQHKIISFNTTTMTSLGFIGPPPKFSSHPQSSFFAQVPPNYFGLKFLGPPIKFGGGGCYHVLGAFSFKSLFTKGHLFEKKIYYPKNYFKISLPKKIH